MEHADRAASITSCDTGPTSSGSPFNSQATSPRPWTGDSRPADSPGGLVEDIADILPPIASSVTMEMVLRMTSLSDDSRFLPTAAAIKLQHGSAC